MHYKQKVTPALLTCLAVFAILGSGRGLEEGTISGCVYQPSFQRQFGLDHLSPHVAADRKATIVSMVQLGSILGALLGFPFADYSGRVVGMRVLLLLWITGVVVQITTFADNAIFQICAGRFITGMGLGMSTVVAPSYLVEISPVHIRGLCGCLFTGSVYLGTMVGYFANYGTTLHMQGTHNRNQWVVPISLQLIFSGVSLFGSFYVIESPAWLVRKGRVNEAQQKLALLRGLDLHDAHLLEEMEASMQVAKEMAVSNHGLWPKLVGLVTTYKYRMFIGLAIQLLSQWSGASSLTLYAPDYFRIVGIKSHNDQLLATSIFGVVKLCASLTCGFLLIDRFGRKRTLYTGIGFQTLAMVYLAIFETIRSNSSPEANASSAAHNAGIVAMLMLYLNGAGWALGWNTAQYLINAELFPTQYRMLTSGILMVFHYVNNYGVARAVPLMFVGLTQYGTLIFFAVVTALGWLFVILFVPELSGMSLEAIDRVFDLPWYKIARHKKPVVRPTSLVLASGTTMHMPLTRRMSLVSSTNSTATLVEKAGAKDAAVIREMEKDR